jgi:V/A-type H+-transporting ATPase subunit K
MESARKAFAGRIRMGTVGLLAVMAIVALVSMQGVGAQARETAEAAQTAGSNTATFAFIAAALAFGFGAIGAGFAIAHVGAAAMGAIGEKPEIAGQALIFIALAEGLVVFGFITALMILGKV